MKRQKAEGGRKRRRALWIVPAVIAGLLIAAAAAALFVMRTELRIIASIRKVDSAQPFYTMDIKDGYHLDELLEADCSTDAELAEVLSRLISHGMYAAPAAAETHIGCSALTCVTEDGRLVWGRNFDWYEPVPIIVRATPKDGYASVSTCEFANITGSADVLPEGLENSFLAIAAYFVPMDGVNEKGLCVAELEINEGGQVLVDTERKNITVTLAIRMLLDRAATVDEAIALLEKYDICPSGGISGHLAISDRTGRAVVAEFTEGRVAVTETPACTNFCFFAGDYSAGGESALRRYETLIAAHEAAGGVMTAEQLTSAMESVSQSGGTWKTRWTLVFEYTGEGEDALRAVYYFGGDYSHAVTVTLRNDVR